MAPARFWDMTASLRSLEAMEACEKRTGDPNAIAILNRREMGAAIDARRPLGEGRFEPARSLGDAFPVLKLHVACAEFRPDLFLMSGHFVSRRFREIADLPPDCADYLPVDDGDCPPEVRAMGYAFLWVKAERDALDMEKSARLGPFRPGMPAPPVGMDKMVFRDDFEADTPIFLTPYDARIIATDAFAEKLLRAGVDDVAFIEIENRLSADEREVKKISRTN